MIHARGSVVITLLANLALPRASGATDAKADSGPSSETALHLALWTTLGGVAAGTALATTSRTGEGVLLAASSLAIGPSVGHFYAGEVSHGVWMSAGRAALVLGAGVSLLVGAFQCFSLGFEESPSDTEPCEPSNVPYYFSAAFATGALGLAVYDIVDAPRAARRARASIVRVSFMPALQPDGGAGAVLAGTF